MTARRTIASVWAHYDDDLLFANPTIDRAIAAGDRVRALFLTASDAGRGLADDYAADRETGIRAAYDVMRGRPGDWRDRTETLAPGVSVTVTAPEGDPRVALSFLRLPDGGLSGNGWYPTGYRTLPRLLRGEQPTLATLDTGDEFTVDRLVAAVGAFVRASEATEVLTTLPSPAAESEGDHPDHRSAGDLVAAAVAAGLVDEALVRWATGYPSSARPANLDTETVARKVQIFAAYAAYDTVLARDPADYLAVKGFGDWLRREYLTPT